MMIGWYFHFNSFISPPALEQEGRIFVIAIHYKGMDGVKTTSPAGGYDLTKNNENVNRGLLTGRNSALYSP